MKLQLIDLFKLSIPSDFHAFNAEFDLSGVTIKQSDPPSKIDSFIIKELAAIEDGAKNVKKRIKIVETEISNTMKMSFSVAEHAEYNQWLHSRSTSSSINIQQLEWTLSEWKSEHGQFQAKFLEALKSFQGQVEVFELLKSYVQQIESVDGSSDPDLAKQSILPFICNFLFILFLLLFVYLKIVKIFMVFAGFFWI